MLIKKFTAASLLCSGSYLISKKSNLNTLAFCEQQTQAEKGASDLDAIFQTQDGGIPPDPEEIQEMLMKAQGRSIRKPPQFQKMNLSLKILTMVEPLDGFKFDFMVPFSQRFQLGGSWNFSNSKANKFEVQSAFTSMPSGNSLAAQEEMSFVSARKDSTGRLEVNGNVNLGKGWSLKPDMFFMDNDTSKAHVQLELMKEFADSHMSYKVGGGMQSVSWMQTLNSQLMAGFEMFYVPQQREVFFCYGSTFNYDIHSFFAQYLPIARKETISLGYIGRPSKRLTMFSELKGSLEGFSDTLVGFRVKFMEGMVTGSLSSSLKATSVYRHYIENILVLSFQSSIDFAKPDKPATFGVSLSVGAM